MAMQMDNTFAPIGGHLGGPTGARAENLCSGMDDDLGVSAMTSTTSGSEQMKVIKATDVFPDLHHKMSKKIAQLTKVIYHLNTKNEDHEVRCTSHPFLALLWYVGSHSEMVLQGTPTNVYPVEGHWLFVGIPLNEKLNSPASRLLMNARCTEDVVTVCC